MPISALEFIGFFKKNSKNKAIRGVKVKTTERDKEVDVFNASNISTKYMIMLKLITKNLHGDLKSSNLRFLTANTNAPITQAPIKKRAAVIAPGSISLATNEPRTYETETKIEKNIIATWPNNSSFFAK